MAYRRILIRRDTAANWTANNPTLAAGEFGHETDTGKLKLGDGSTAWTSLGYQSNVTSVNGSTGAVTGLAPLASPTFTGTPTLPTGTIATTQTASNNSTAIATTAYVDAADALKANLASPTFTGTPTLPTGTIATTQSVADNSTKVATTAFVRGEVTALVNSATATLDTLGEIATALGNDANLSTTLTTSIGLKAPLASPTFTGTVIGNPAAGTTSTGTSGFGYMGLPQNSATTGAYGVVAADAGLHIYSSATRTITIPANGTIAMPIGSTVVFIAGSGATVTIAITTDTMYLAGLGTTGSRTLAAFGMATAVKITSTSWIISGNGLT